MPQIDICCITFGSFLAVKMKLKINLPALNYGMKITDKEKDLTPFLPGAMSLSFLKLECRIPLWDFVYFGFESCVKIAHHFTFSFLLTFSGQLLTYEIFTVVHE